MPSKENNRAIISVTFVKVYHFQGTSPKCSGYRVVAKMSTKPCLSLYACFSEPVCVHVGSECTRVSACLSVCSQSVSMPGWHTD